LKWDLDSAAGENTPHRYVGLRSFSRRLCSQSPKKSQIVFQLFFSTDFWQRRNVQVVVTAAAQAVGACTVLN
jgi:hypothetical protein